MKMMVLLFIFISAHAIAQTDSLASGVYRWDSLPVKKGAGRESRALLRGHTTDLALLSIHTSTLGPGLTNHPLQAYSNREEVIMVREGNLKVCINDGSKIIGPGGIVLIVAGDRQSFQNVSAVPVTYCVLQFTSTVPADSARGKKSGGSVVKNFAELPVKKTDKGESRPVFDRPSFMFSRFEIHATLLNPGFESHAPHTHRAEEIMLLMKGNVTAHVGGETRTASAGDVLLLTPNVPHNVVNTGSEPCWYYAIKWFQ